MRKNKKLVSTVVTGALVATMAMPVMAESGHVDVDLTTKTAVLRVQVPTSMNVAVNQFEMGDTGSQIYSNAFEMENKSEIPVKVNVTSTASVKSGHKLLDTKAAAEASTTAGEAWMAVAAQTSDGKYIEGGKGIADLSEADDNVTSFINEKTNQTFYLEKSGTMAYKLLNANESAADIEYAEFYELTAETISGGDDAAKQAALNALVKDNDVYVAAAAAADGQALTKVAKGSTTEHPYSGTEVYYTAATEATAKGSITASNLYVYGDGTTSSNTAATTVKAAFRYIGKLSEAQESWSKEDISKIVVSYDILGVKQSQYDEIAGVTAGTTSALTYGLYKDPALENAAPSIDSADLTKTVTAGTAVEIPVSLGVGDKGAENVSSVTWLGVECLDGNLVSFADNKVTISAAFVDSLLSDPSAYLPASFIITFDDSEETEVTVTLNN